MPLQFQPSRFDPGAPVLLWFDKSYAAAQANTTLVTPSQGRCLVIATLELSLSAAGAFTISAGNAGDGANIMGGYLPGSGRVPRDYLVPRKLPKDQPLKLTTPAGQSWVGVAYWEEAP